MDPVAEAQFDVTEADVIALNIRVMRHSPLYDTVRRRNWRSAIITGILLLVALAVVAETTAPTPQAGLTRIAGWSLAYAAIWALFAGRTLSRDAFDRRMVRIAERLVRTRKVPFTLGPCRIALLPDRLQITDAGGTAHRPWADFTHAKEEPDALYFELADGAMFRIPHRAFVSDAESRAFAEQAAALIGP